MTPWQDFYDSIRDQSWPDCKDEKDFFNLPAWIQDECQQRHGYVPGQYQRQPSMVQKVFPIKTETACQLKWNWSTIYLTTETTASCHRTNHHQFDTDTFDFHNTPEKLQDRQRMLQGQWPESGCNYCQQIEAAGGQSDRITNLNFPGMHAPIELDTDPTAVSVTPRILEVYFNNTCNLKCVYCGPFFSSLWAAENYKFGRFDDINKIVTEDFVKSKNIKQNVQKVLDWLVNNGQHLTQFNILGGEPLFQDEFDRCLDLFDQHPAPDLEVQIFSNLNVSHQRVQHVLARIDRLISEKKIRGFSVTASLDCWGSSQEYARFPLDLALWEKNFQLLLSRPDIRLVIGSTITPLTIWTLPDLMRRMQQWRQRRPVYHYFNSVNAPSHMFIDIFGDLFWKKFHECIELCDPAQPEVKSYLEGIARQSISRGTNVYQIKKLKSYLDELDRRRGTDWKTTFPWLVQPITDIVAV